MGSPCKSFFKREWYATSTTLKRVDDNESMRIFNQLVFYKGVETLLWDIWIGSYCQDSWTMHQKNYCSLTDT